MPLYLDTETTGLYRGDGGEVVEVAVVDEGNWYTGGADGGGASGYGAGGGGAGWLANWNYWDVGCLA